MRFTLFSVGRGAGRRVSSSGYRFWGNLTVRKESPRARVSSAGEGEKD